MHMLTLAVKLQACKQKHSQALTASDMNGVWPQAGVTLPMCAMQVRLHCIHRSVFMETSVLHSRPLRCYLALCYRDDTHTPNYGGEQLTRCYLLFRSLQCMLHKLKRRFETLLGTWLLFAQSVGMFVQKVQYNLGSIG